MYIHACVLMWCVGIYVLARVWECMCACAFGEWYTCTRVGSPLYVCMYIFCACKVCVCACAYIYMCVCVYFFFFLYPKKYKKGIYIYICVCKKHILERDICTNVCVVHVLSVCVSCTYLFFFSLRCVCVCVCIYIYTQF
jgi:hypothetical protein